MTMVFMKTMIDQVGRITESVKSQYARLHLGNSVDVYVFTGIPKHYACPHCFQKDNIQVLRYRRIASGFFECPACKSIFPATCDKGLLSHTMKVS